MKDQMTLIQNAAAAIEKACGRSDIAVILGSGLGDYVEALENPRGISYKEIPGFPVSTVPGHAGRWVAGELHGKRVCMMQGRFHAYEGYPLSEVTLPIRVMARLGVKTLIVTNACGGVNLSFKPGDLMLISDFINLAGMNPLIGPNLDEFGPRFPDMTRAFDREYLALAEACGQELGLKLQKGVYCWMSGPCFESPAEIKMARIIGADAVGMSTVPEVIVARHSGLRVLGVSCITNMAAGILDQPLNHAEVMETGNRVKNTFRGLLDKVIESM